MDIVKKLIDFGADVNIGVTLPLCVTIPDFNIRLLRLLLDSKADPNIRNSDGFSLLHLAVRAGKAASVRQLLRTESCRVNEAAEINYETPLHICAQTGNTSIAELLLNTQ
eukprot:UN24881